MYWCWDAARIVELLLIDLVLQFFTVAMKKFHSFDRHAKQVFSTLHWQITLK